MVEVIWPAVPDPLAAKVDAGLANTGVFERVVDLPPHLEPLPADERQRAARA